MIQYCKQCILPDVRPGVRLDAEGVCQGCRTVASKADIDWGQRATSFRTLVDNAQRRATTYDCLIPVSGGKDSYWQVVTCLEHGLRPLCVTYVCPGQNDLGRTNLKNLAALGVDHFEFRVNPEVERLFIEKTFRKMAMSGLVTNMAIYSMPIQLAVAYDIPLVVYGENSAFEYGTEDDSLTGASLDSRWLASFGVSNGTTAADWVDDELTREALTSFFTPPDDILVPKDLHVIFLGYYFPWDTETSRSVAVEHGFQVRAEGPRVGHYNYANLDDDLLGIHHHAKWHKFGLTRSWDNLAIEIRAGRISRNDAIDLLRERGDETPWNEIPLFCDYIGITEKEYFDIVERFRNPDIWTRRNNRWEIDGFLIPDFSWPSDSP